MTEDEKISNDYRFHAFVSYRQAEPDRTWARWLHRALETYRIPEGLSTGPIELPKALRVFRDEDELAATSRLKASIREALVQSRWLIVICSPRTLESRWVNEEVVQFRALGREQRILPVLIEGTPDTAFPPALREIGPGLPTPGGGEGARRELLTTDVRGLSVRWPHGPKRRAVLGLIACLAACRREDLMHWDQEARGRRLRLAGQVLAALVLIQAGLTWYALGRRAEATAARDVEIGQRDVARGEAAIARERLADAYEETGRQAFTSAPPKVENALVWWNEAYALGSRRSTLLYLLASARRQLEASRTLSASSGILWGAEFGAAGGLVITAAENGKVQLWDTTTAARTGTLSGHKGQVLGVGISPDGSRVVTAGADGTAILWDLAARKRLRSFQGHRGNVFSARFSADGRQIVTAGADRTARVWEADRDGPHVKSLPHPSAVHCAEPSPDLRSLATAGADGAVRLWALAGQQEPAVLDGHGEAVRSVRFSPDGRLLVSAGDDGVAILWDIATRRLLRRLAGHRAALMAARFSPDGRRIVTASRDGTAKVWEAERDVLVETLLGHTSELTSAAFSPSGDRLLTSGADGKAILRVPGAGRLRAEFAAGDRLAINPKGDRLLTTGGGAVVLRDAIGRPLRSVPWGHTEPVISATFSPDGREILTGSQDGSVKRWDAATGKLRATLPGTPGDATTAAYSADGQHVLTWGSQRPVQVWNSAGALALTLGVLELPDEDQLKSSRQQAWCGADVIAVVGGIATNPGSPDRAQTAIRGRPPNSGINVGAYRLAGGRRLRKEQKPSMAFLGFDAEGRVATVEARPSQWIVSVWDAASGERIHSFPVEHTVLPSADGRWVASAGTAGPLRVLRVSTGAEAGVIDGAGDGVVAFDVDANGRHAVTVPRGKAPEVWDLRERKKIAQLAATTSDVERALMSPTGDWIITEHARGAARLWNAETGALIGPLGTLWYRASSPCFSPDGTRALTCDGTKFRVWDCRTGRTLVEPRPDGGPVRWAGFRSDGRRILVADEHVLRCWDEATGQPVVPAIELESPIVTAAQSPVGDRIAIAGRDGVVRIFSLGDGHEISHFGGGGAEGNIACLAFDPTGGRIVTGGNDGLVVVRASDDGSEIRRIAAHKGGMWNGVAGVAFSPDGLRLLSGGEDGQLRAWALSDGSLLWEQVPGGGVRYLCFTPNGSIVAVAAVDNGAGRSPLFGRRPEGAMALLDGQTGRTLEPFGWYGPGAFHPDGDRLLTCSFDGLVRVWSVESAREDPRELDAWVKKRIPLRIRDGLLVGEPEPSGPAPGSVPAVAGGTAGTIP